ncbi:MAG: winged helix-turn-helix domain-containing protein, partial [Rudaea sp.]
MAGRRLFVAGKETALEPKAFATLAFLIREPGRAFSRDEILDAVWNHRHVTPGVLNR